MRTLGQRHFDVQVMGGAALHFGWVAEMKTGEGKTLVATLPLFLNALAGRGAHLVTVNDYLAKFHATWMSRLYGFLGLETGVVLPQIDDFDGQARGVRGRHHLRHQQRVRLRLPPRQHDHHARGSGAARPRVRDRRRGRLHPHRRSAHAAHHLGRADDAQELYVQFATIVKNLQRDRDYEVDEAKRTVVPTEEGVERVESALGVTNLYEHVNQNFVHQIQAALRAKELFKKDVDYVVADGEVKIVDEFTGRILEGRRWSEGLHQAVEAKERVKIKEENQTLATITLQNYFRMYEKLAGMTGTANTEAGEFAHTYGLDVVSIPTNRPMVRVDQPDLIYKSESAKFEAAADDIAERHEAGQPVLVGTISVEKSELLSRLLEKRGIHAPGAEREAARAGGARRRAGRAPRLRHRRHQHGRPRRRHPARRRPRGPRAPRSCSRAAARSRSHRRSSRSCSIASATSASRRRHACASSAGSTCSAPSATRAAASTTSSVAAPVGRVIPARAASTSRSKTTSCGCSRPAR